VPHEALRLRMVALHGREDALLDLPRFLRLLRQANDAEIADVRQVSDTEYEVTPHRLEAAQTAARSQPPAAREPAVDATPTVEAPVPSADPDARNGQRFGIRFRRGSRGGVRMADIPLIGMVHADTPEPVLELVEVVAETPDATAPAGRAARAPRKRASKPKTSAAKATEPPAEEAAGEAPAAAPRRRPRPRAPRKAE
jgi:hypothetical protein